MNIHTIHIGETTSTNDWLRSYQADGGEDITVVTAEHQTAGRGQGTNRWESEEGQNLLFSIMVRPRRLPVRSQYLLSEAAALAFREALTAYLPEGQVTVKWPNDIYFGDRKISGTLIETSITSRGMERAVIGTGINVNQQVFRSDAPNPVSMRQILGRDTDREELLRHVTSCFEKYYAMLDQGMYADIAAMYHSVLYRRTGFHRYEDAGGTFEAALVEVEDDGHLILRDRRGAIRSYAFKEVKAVISPANPTANQL